VNKLGSDLMNKKALEGIKESEELTVGKEQSIGINETEFEFNVNWQWAKRRQEKG